MTISRDDPSPHNSSSVSFKNPLLVSIRRLNPKTRRESSPEDQRQRRAVYTATTHAEHGDLSASARIRYSMDTMRDDSSPSYTPVYCPPLASPPPPPRRRIRMSGTRLPSGFRPTQKAPNLPFSSVDMSPQLETRSETDSQVYRTDTDRSPVRTRITRFLHRNAMVSPPPSSPSSSTPASSTLSFPSSSSRTTTPSTSPAMSLKQKKVRFSPSVPSLEDTRKKAREEKERVVDVLTRIGSPWRKSSESRVNRP